MSVMSLSCLLLLRSLQQRFKKKMQDRGTNGSVRTCIARVKVTLFLLHFCAFFCKFFVVKFNDVNFNFQNKLNLLLFKLSKSPKGQYFVEV